MKSDNKPEASQKPKRRPFHEEFAEKIIEHLKAGTAPWQQPWHPGKTLAAPHNPASGTVYRGMNRVHLALSGYEDPRWMTLRQANDNGLRILPGSRATPVVYFQFTKEQDRIGEDGKPVMRPMNRAAWRSTRRRRLNAFKATSILWWNGTSPKNRLWRIAGNAAYPGTVYMTFLIA